VTPLRAAPEADATRDLYERYARQIHAYCMHQLGNREEAEDAVQSTFLNAFRGLKRGVDPEFETAWLYKIAENVCLTRQRSSSRRRRVESPGDLDAMQDFLPAHQADSDELIRLPEALEEMPEQQRRALLLREWQGLSYKEISAELGLSQAAVETLLFRARRSLASALTDEPKEKKAGVAKKLRADSDAGSLLALLKTLIFAGGAKVAATVAAVAVTSVVAATPAVRHTLEHAVAPSHSQPAQPHTVAPKSVATLQSTAGAKRVAPLSHQIGSPARHANAAGTSGTRLHVGHAPLAPVEGTELTSTATAPASASAPTVGAPVAAAAPTVEVPTQAEVPREAGPSGTGPSQVKGEAKKDVPLVAASAPSKSEGTADAKATRDAAKADRNIASASTSTPDSTTTVAAPAAAAPALPPGQAKKNDPATTGDPAPATPSATVAAAVPVPQSTPAAPADGNTKPDRSTGNGHRK
jgi:RNA polymerase sigma factor (sigma-70 family)